MSHGIEEQYDVYNESNRRARTEHKCCACDETIRRGDQYTSVRIIFQREVEIVNRCARCQKIHEHLRTLAPGDAWPSERLDCGEEYADHWGTEPPPEIAALAFALPNDAKPITGPAGTEGK